MSKATENKERPNFSVQPHKDSRIKRVIGVVSGKGGVGKSLITSLLAVLMNRKGYNTAIMDADVTGPSIPKAFGLNQRAKGGEGGLYPVKSRTGIDIMSINLLLPDATDPVIWRGPILANVIKQFWSDVIWGDVDYMFIDLPPGTGDVPLTVFQSLAVDGIIIVTSPQELVSIIVAKAVKMAEMMNIPIMGLVENMAYFQCPGCAQQYNLFGNSHIDLIAKEHGLNVLGRLPVDPAIAKACDEGKIEDLSGNWLDSLADSLTKMEEKK